MDHPNDHDLLIELRTEMRGLRIDVNNLTNTTTEKVKELELTKFDSKTFTDTWGREIHESRSRITRIEDTTIPAMHLTFKAEQSHLDTEVNKIKEKLAYYAGAVTIINAAISIAVAFYLKS